MLVTAGHQPNLPGSRMILIIYRITFYLMGLFSHLWWQAYHWGAVAVTDCGDKNPDVISEGDQEEIMVKFVEGCT